MLVIRMQRTGRKGHAQFRVVVQDSRRTPTSGKVVANIGTFNPHSKETVIDKEKVSFYLEHGAQPTDRVARLLKSEGIKLPEWVKISESKVRTIRNPEKLRRNRPEDAEAPVAEPEEAAPADAEPEAAPASEEAPVTEETPAETPAVEEPVAEVAAAEPAPSEEVAATEEADKKA